MEYFWSFILIIGALCAVTVAIGLTGMAITGCLGQISENMRWVNNVWGRR